MRLNRLLLLTAAILTVVAAWPQDPPIPAVDHTQHPMVEVETGLPVPSMAVRLIPDMMDGYNVFLETTNFRFTPENVGMEAVPNEGHAHLYLNGVKVARMYTPWHHLSANLLREGVNRLELEFSANDHSVWSVAGSPIGTDVLIDTLSSGSDPIIREEVRYSLDWRWDRAKPHSAGGWTARNDVGYDIHVTEGRVVSRNLELVPCYAVPQPSPQAWLDRWLAPPRVLAGHSSLLPNESKITKSYEEDLASPAMTFLEGRVVTDPEYCRAHYLIARPTGTGPGAASLQVTGTWNRQSTGTSGSFRFESPGAFGQFLNFRTASGEDLARRSIVGGIDVTIRRSLATMFDGVDFANAEPDVAGMKIMRTLVSSTEVEIQGG